MYVDLVEQLGQALEEGRITQDEAVKQLQDYAARLRENAPRHAVLQHLMEWRTIRREYERIAREESTRKWRPLS